MFLERTNSHPPKPPKTRPRPSSIVLGAALLIVSASGVSAQTRGGFTNASVQGSYSAQEEGDNRVSVGFGIVTYNGRGKTARLLTVNAPGENRARRLIQFQAEGTYSINDNGTGTATYKNTLSTGAATEVTFDLVITEARIAFLSGQRAKLATELFAVQREAGVTVSLATSNQKRLP